jgi:flagellar hook-basal body complex protein FliE
MSPVSSIASHLPSIFGRNPAQAVRPGGVGDVTSPQNLAGGVAAGGQPTDVPFNKVIDGLVSTVNTKQAEANDITRKVLLGETDQLHQGVIAMQEASVAFSLMVEVRNKLVESYQELMRMPV